MVQHVHLLYVSPTGSTRTVANAIAFGLEAEVDLNCDVTLASARKRAVDEGLSFDADDVVVICSPVYADRIPPIFSQFLLHVHAHGAKAILAVVYGDRGYGDALLELSDICIQQGFVPLCAGAFPAVHSFDRLVGEGRPDAQDLDAMHALGRIALEKLADGTTLLQQIPGNRPYKALKKDDPPYGVVLTGECVGCGKCLQVCPVDAIVVSGTCKVDPAVCIRCNACVLACPAQVLQIVDGRHQAILQWLASQCRGNRHVCELFS